MATKRRPRKEQTDEGGRNADTSDGGGMDGDGVSGELQSSPEVRTALIDGVTFTNKAVQYTEIDGLAMFEGDIVLGTAEEVRQATETRQRIIADVGTGDAGPVLQSVGISGTQFRWPNGQIPYEIDPALPSQQRVTDAISHWQANTSIRFVLRTAANQAQFPDFVRFVPGGGCSSQVGRRGGQQNVTLGSGCTTGNAIHEIGHTVGLWHEQSREDRDNFVTIAWANITTGFEHNFNQHITDGDDLGAYDYGSIMHYPRNAFTRNGQDTIVPVQAGAQIGQRTGLSAGDLAGVRIMYPSLKTKVADDPIVKLKVVDDRKIKVIDDLKLKFRDDPIKQKVLDDPIVKRKVLDDLKLKVTDDKLKFADDVKLPGLDLGRPSDFGGRSGATLGLHPFVLATPHHAAVGGQAPGGAFDPQQAQYEAALLELEAQLVQLKATIDALQTEYARVLTEYQQVGEALGQSSG